MQSSGAGWYYNWGTAPSNTGPRTTTRNARVSRVRSVTLPLSYTARLSDFSHQPKAEVRGGLLAARRSRSDLVNADAGVRATLAGLATGLSTVAAYVPLPYEPGVLPTPYYSHVGEYGATVFSSALHRVAIVNNIPIGARNFSHGSIATRMKYLHELSEDPSRTAGFDRVMLAVYAMLVLALLICGAAAIIVFERNGGF